MNKSMKALTMTFLGLGLFLAAPSFAEEATAPETQTFTAEEVASAKRATNLNNCKAISLMDSFLSERKRSVAQDMEAEVLACEESTGITSKVADSFMDGLRTKYGENFPAVEQNSAPLFGIFKPQ